MTENTNKNNPPPHELRRDKVVTRFAPSPTGFMHVGGVRTALYAWLWARKNDGTFILRIEDTDKEREVEGSIEQIMESLKWLGIDWDEGPDKDGANGPYIQSQRLESYQKYAKILVEKGLAYADPYTEEELTKFREQADAEKRPFLYRDHRPENPPVWDGSMPLRFKTPELKKYVWNDLVWGELSAGEEALDDFILVKSDGYPTYNFAHIIDDIEMGVTHIVRGQEFISSTPKFLSVYEALGVTPPFFVTTPPIMGPDGKKKLGKRDGAKDILEYRAEGYTPDAMINFLALLGWHPEGDKEIFTREELIAEFKLERIQRSGAQLGDDKLDWLNKEHLKLMRDDERNKNILEWLKNIPAIAGEEKLGDEKFMSKIYPIIFDRISKWGDIYKLVQDEEIQYFFSKPGYTKEMLSWKGASLEDSKKHLEHISEVFNSATDDDFSDAEKIKSLIFDYATEQGRGNVLWPLRVSLSGKEKSPDPFTLAYILGKAETLERIAIATAKI